MVFFRKYHVLFTRNFLKKYNHDNEKVTPFRCHGLMHQVHQRLSKQAFDACFDSRINCRKNQNCDHINQ